MSIELNQFSQPEFDVKEWLNSTIDALSSPTPKAGSADSNGPVDSAAGQNSTPGTTKRHASPLEDGMSVLLAKLHFMTAEAQTNLDRARVRFIQTAPRISRDIAVLHKDLMATQKAAQTMQPYLLRSDAESHDVLARTVRMQWVRDCMVQGKAMLERAREWASLPKHVNEFKAKGDYVQAWNLAREARTAAQQVAGCGPLGHGEDNHGGSDELRSQLEVVDALANDLISDAEANLGSAVRSGDSEKTQKWVEFLSLDDIGQSQRAQTIVLQERSRPWIQLWNHNVDTFIRSSSNDAQLDFNTAQEHDDHEPLPSAKLLDYRLPDLSVVNDRALIRFLDKVLDGFYNKLLAGLAEELNWYALAGLPDVTQCCNRWLQIVTHQVSSTVTSFLIAAKSRLPTQQLLLLLVHSFEATNTFVFKAEREMKVSQSVFSISDARGGERPADNASSSVEPPASGTYVAGTAWASTLLRPFTLYQQQYPELERQCLTWQFGPGRFPRSPSEMEDDGAGSSGERALSIASLPEHIRFMRDIATPRFFSLVKDAVGRMLAFTGGFSAPGLVDVVDRHALRPFHVMLARFLVKIMRIVDVPDRLHGGQPTRRDFISAAGVRTVGEQGSMQNAAVDADDSKVDNDEVIRVLLLATELCLSIGDHVRLLNKDVLNALADLNRAMDTKVSRGDSTTVGFSDALAALPLLSVPTYQVLFDSTLYSPGLRDCMDRMFARKEPVFPVLTDALTSLLPATAQSLVFNFAYRHIHRAISSTADAQEAYHLGSKAQTPTDGSVGKAKAISTMGVEIPTFSLSPSGYIRSIGEQILVLPQTLERMDIVAISLAEQLMPPSTSLRGTGNVGTEGGGLDAKVSVQALSDKLLILEQSQLPYYSAIPGRAGQAKEAASDCRQTISRDEAKGYDYAATHLLLFATLFSTQYDFIRHTLLPEAPIYQDYESAVNVDQILTDMDYLASIMRSLDVDLVDDFRRWHRAVGAGEKSRLLGLAGEIGDDIVQTVAKLRRW